MSQYQACCPGDDPIGSESDEAADEDALMVAKCFICGEEVTSSQACEFRADGSSSWTFSMNSERFRTLIYRHELCARPRLKELIHQNLKISARILKIKVV